MSMPKELKRVKKVDTKTTGLPYDNNHDPSNIIKYNELYYFWYTQHMNNRPFSAFKYCKIMYKTSADGIHWSDGKDALLPSKDGWDNCGVLTAYVVPYEGKFYLFYIGVDNNFCPKTNPVRGCGAAIADHPEGPWTRFTDKQILYPTKGAWDDEACDDITVLNKDGKWLMYYKGRASGLPATRTQVGLATSDRITGPYKKYEGNPLIKGHAFAIWPYKHGFLYLAGLNDENTKDTRDIDYWNIGKRSLFWSEDGITFEPCCEFPNVSVGLYTSIVHDGTQDDVSKFWGLMVGTKLYGLRRYIKRFDFCLEEES